MNLKTITYTSRVRLDLTEEGLADIHRSARHLNALDGISGLLVFDGVRFLQVVEGSDEAIDGLMERLLRDPRHSSVEVRDHRSLDVRAFPDWSMELVRVSEGYFTARTEMAALLPETMPAEARARILGMAGEMGEPSD